MPKNSPKTQKLYNEAKKFIPGGSNLFSKRPELYAPNVWPSHYSKAKGIEVTDIDGNKYLDFTTCGLGACILGYADPDVDKAVTRAIQYGSASTLNCAEEVELARLLTTIHPWASKARFTRSGGEAMAVALRIARTHTGRNKVLVCSYAGWHVNDPTSGNYPVDPDSVSNLKFNDINDLIRWVGYTKLAAVVMEPRRLEEPTDNYLHEVSRLCRENGAILIFDEITSGFRFNLGGSHLKYNVTPDIAVFAKAISNGYPMAAILGNDVMDATEKTFISSTSWSERIGPTAALATIYKLWNEEIYSHITDVGSQVQSIWKFMSKRCGVPITISGPPELSHIDFGSLETQTLYTQLMLEKGFLASKDFYPTYAHHQEHVEKFLNAVREVFPQLQRQTFDGSVAQKGMR